jgi:predicted nucleic acid-binding protein
MTGPVFIAADALVARHLTTHPQHAAAQRLWSHLAAERPPLLTIPAMLDAAASTLARSCDPAFAAERARRWAASDALELVQPTPDDHQQALDWLARYRDPEASLGDCWAWAVMARLHVSTAFTFREAYRWAGHRLLGELRR